MIPIPWRVLGFLVAILGGFAGGALWHKGVCDRRALALQHAQDVVVAQQQARNVKALQDQLAVNQAIGAENAKLQSANADADVRLRGLLRQLAAQGSAHPLPGAPAGAGGTAAAPEVAGCARSLDELSQRTADLAEAARSDATELTLLQRWASQSGLMN